MKIWQLWADSDNYASFARVEAYTADDIQSFDGRSHANSWKPLKVEKIDTDKELDLGDMVSFTTPVFSEEAVNCLMQLIHEYVEFLQLDYTGKKYFAVNVTKVIDAIDYEKSEFVKFKSSNRIMRFKKYAFVPEEVSGISIFKITDEKRRVPFVSDEFKMMVEKNNLSGFKFKLVWDSEAD